jgi:hypothetical protein
VLGACFLLVSCLTFSLALKMEAIRHSEFKRSFAELETVTSQKRVAAVNIGSPTYFRILINIFMKYLMEIEGTRN